MYEAYFARMMVFFGVLFLAGLISAERERRASTRRAAGRSTGQT